MGFLDKLRNMIKPEDRSYEDIMKERSKIKDEIAQTLKETNFTDLEVKEVLLIVDDTEKRIEVLKRKITNLSRSFEDPTGKVEAVKQEISEETRIMNEKLRAKVQEIIARKQTRS